VGIQSREAHAFRAPLSSPLLLPSYKHSQI
jgi:hypothetical protein